jgi:phosphatidylglycerophosphate synthase
MLFNSLIIIMSVISSYLYAYMAAFENELSNPYLLNTILIFECFFLASILLNFLVEYQD